MLSAVRRRAQELLRVQAASGVVLMAFAAAALAWANSPWASSYARFWNTEHAIWLPGHAARISTSFVVNDALMAIFFFVVGLEIRRELDRGELSDWKRAALPAFAAVGGMVVPAVLYSFVVGAPGTRTGWGVPMATDIAFAVGVLTLLGTRTPPPLRVLLLALAIIDDLGAILVIALFYSNSISGAGLLLMLGAAGVVLVMQRARVHTKAYYLVPGVAMWAGALIAGIHPTIAGVLMGLLTPTRPVSDKRGETSPGDVLIAKLHPWVAFGIMPVFALANAGVSLRGVSFDGATKQVMIGVLLGLVVGKPVGVLAATFLALRLRVGVLPEGIGPRHLVTLGLVAGIGFTMSLFISQLAFHDAELLAASKVGVFIASAVAGVVGLVFGRATLRRKQEQT